MRFLVVGENFKGAFGELIYNNLVRLGIETEKINTGDFFKLSFINRVLNKFLKVPHYFGCGVRKLNKIILELASSGNFDFILFLKPTFIYPKTIVEIKKYSKIIGLTMDHVDIFKTNSDYFYESIPSFDLYLVGRRDIGQSMYKLGAKKVYNFLMQADLICHYPVKASKAEKEKFGVDIVFFGTYAKGEKRVEYLEKLCKEGYDVKIYGNSWDWYRLPWNSCLRKKNKIIRGGTPCEKMSKIISLSKIVLAFMRDAMGEVIALRTSEIPLCEGFMLHQRTKEAEDFLIPDKEAVFFSDYKEMKEKIDFYLKHPELREKIAKAGYNKILNSGLLNYDMVKKLFSILKIKISDKAVLVIKPI